MRQNPAGGTSYPAGGPPGRSRATATRGRPLPGTGQPLPEDKHSRSAINRRNRRKGSAAQTEWAKIIHGRNVGILGAEDVDDGFRLWEVKARKLPKWILDAYAQVAKHPSNRLRYVAIRHGGGPGVPVTWWVIQPASQFIDVNGYGQFEGRK